MGTVRNGDRPTTVYLVGDEEIVRSGLRRILQAAGAIVVGETASVAVAMREILLNEPQVVVVDDAPGDGGGIGLCRALHVDEPDVGVVVLASSDDEAALFAAIDAGARGYLLREATARQFVDTVMRVARGQACLDPAVTAPVLDRVRRGDALPGGRLRTGPSSALTHQERRVLALVGDGLTNRQIGQRLSLAEQTVKNHVSAVLAKLHLQRRSQLVLWVARHPSAVRSPVHPGGRRPSGEAAGS